MYTKTAMTESLKHYLRPGYEIVWAGIHCRVLHWTNENEEKTETNEDEYIDLENYETKQKRRVSVADLRLGIDTGQLIVRQGVDEHDANLNSHIVKSDSELQLVSEAAQEFVMRIKDWDVALKTKNITKLNPNRELDLLTIEDLKKDKELNLHPFSPWTIYKNLKKLRDANGDITVLIPKYNKRGSPKQVKKEEGDESLAVVRYSRLHPEVDQMLSKIIEDARKDKHHKMSPEKIRKELKKKLQNDPIYQKSSDIYILPSAVTVARRINRAMTQYEIDEHRNSPEGAKNLYRNTGARIEAQRILEIVQYDDIDTRGFLIDPDTGRPWGTAYMTFGVDERSRAVLGSCYGAEHRNTESALQTLFNSIRHKDMSAHEFSTCENQWVMSGTPGLALLDNASYNKSLSFKMTLLGLGIDYALARPKTPQNKSAVEHFNYRFKHEFVANLPGASVNKMDSDGTKRAMKQAKYTLEEFALMANKYIIDEYLPERQNSGESPLEIWNSQKEWVDLREPKLKDMNFKKYTKVEVLKFRQSGGLKRNELRYSNDKLVDLQRRIGWNAEVKIRVNPLGLENIYAYDRQSEEWFSVPCIENENYVRGLTDEVHKRVMKYRRDSKNEIQKNIDWQRTNIDDLISHGYALCKSDQLTKRGEGFQIKLAMKGGTSALINKRTNIVYRIPVMEKTIEPDVKKEVIPEGTKQKKMVQSFQDLVSMAMPTVQIQS